MLHCNDLDERYTLQTRPEDRRPNAQILTKGSRVKVYVKQVLPNSGKFTLTTDSTITREAVQRAKHLKRDAAAKRRTQRRLRKLLNLLKENDEVAAIVEKVNQKHAFILFLICDFVIR